MYFGISSKLLEQLCIYLAAAPAAAVKGDQR